MFAIFITKGHGDLWDESLRRTMEVQGQVQASSCKGVVSTRRQHLGAEVNAPHTAHVQVTENAGIPLHTFTRSFLMGQSLAHPRAIMHEELY